MHTMWISFGFKKEGNSDICYKINKPWEHYASETSVISTQYCTTPSTWYKEDTGRYRKVNGGYQGLRGGNWEVIV